MKIHGRATEKEVFSVLKMTLLNKSDSTKNCSSPLIKKKKKKVGSKRRERLKK